MNTHRLLPWLGLFLALLPAGVAAREVNSGEALHLTVGQKDFLWLEPILVTVRLESKRLDRLPAVPGKGTVNLRFEIQPPLKPRPKAMPLPLEAQAAEARASSRLYDLSEWFIFPAAGTWTVRAILDSSNGTLDSQSFTFSVRRPDKGTAEQGPVDRIHHTPWSNYEANAFCGDTFDLVKRWPTSRLARYCHYWNGRHLQQKKEYAKALDSYRTVVEKYPDFVLADAAAYGMVECLLALKKPEEAQKVNDELLRRCQKQAARAKVGGATVVQCLAQEATQRLQRELARK
jgi:hypothetical protein